MEKHDKVQLITDEGSHWYESLNNPGTYYPSATTILGAAYPTGIGLAMYLAEQESWEASQETLKKAGERGTNVHRATELLEQGKELQMEAYSTEEYQMILGFLQWYADYNPIPIHTEKAMASDVYKVGGSMDRLYMIDGMLVIVDFKTSKKILRKFHIQTAIYDRLLTEVDGVPADKTAVLRLRNIGKCLYQYEERTREEIDADWNIYTHVRAVWDDMYPNAKPKILELPKVVSLQNNPYVKEQARIDVDEVARNATSRRTKSRKNASHPTPKGTVRRSRRAKS